MNGQMVLDKIMDTYRPNFDVEEPYEFHGEVYDAYAGFSMTSAGETRGAVACPLL